MTRPNGFVLQIDSEHAGVLVAGTRSYRFHATAPWSRPCDGRKFGSVAEAEKTLLRLKQARSGHKRRQAVGKDGIRSD